METNPRSRITENFLSRSEAKFRDFPPEALFSHGIWDLSGIFWMFVSETFPVNFQHPRGFTSRSFPAFPEFLTELESPRQAGGMGWRKLIPGFARGSLGIHCFSQRNCCVQNSMGDLGTTWRIRDDPLEPELRLNFQTRHPKFFSLGIKNRAELKTWDNSG